MRRPSASSVSSSPSRHNMKCPLVHQWSARYPAEYSSMRTRTSPNWRVRQRASPATPGWVVTSTWLQSVVPKGRAEIFMASVLAGQHVAEHRAVDIAAGQRQRHAFARQRIAFAPGRGKGGGAGALGD